MKAEKIGTLSDRIANRIVRHFPGERVAIEASQPIISFTFDDAPIEAGTIAAPILEAHGALGTFYVSGRLASDEPDTFLSESQCRELALRGHEIACHTYAHRKVAAFRGAELEADLERSAAFLQRVAPHQARRNFAFPYGMTSPWHRKAINRRFRTARSIHPGVNRGPTDLSNLASVELRPDQSFLDIAASSLEDVAKQPGWLVFFTHDVSDRPSKFGCPTDVFRQLVSRAEAIGAKVMTVDAAADALKLPK